MYLLPFSKVLQVLMSKYLHLHPHSYIPISFCVPTNTAFSSVTADQ